MKKVILFITCIFFTSQISSQKKTDTITYIKETKNNYFPSFFNTKNSFNIGAGLYIPLNNSTNYLNISPLFELNYNIPVTKDKAIEIAAQFIIPSQKKELNYFLEKQLQKAKTTLIFNPSVRFKKMFLKDNKLDLHLGFGASLMSTNIKNPYYQGDKEDNKFERINSLLISIGFSYRFKVFKKNRFTFSLEGLYTPYKNDQNLKSTLNSFALSPKLLYDF